MDKPGIQGQNLFQLDYRQVFITLVALRQCSVIFFDGLIDGIQPAGVGLQSVYIFIRNIFFRLHVLADNPLA